MPAQILDRTFRASPSYQLLPLDRLNDGERDLVGELRDDASCFGVLRPLGKHGSIKVVCRDTALLWKALEHPAPIPGWVRESDDANASVTQLVLDGVLEMEAESSFITGPRAWREVQGSGVTGTQEPEGALAKLSRRALRYGQGLGLSEPALLSARLYQYGRLAASPRWLARFPSRESVRSELEVGPRWTPTPNGAWLAWRLQGAVPQSDQRTLGYKLYVSPRPEHVVDAVRALSHAAAEHGAHHFKVGPDANGLLRPDKIVAYFSNRASLDRTAAAVAHELRGYPAHGVPFTAELAGDGLLSWGVDPSSTGEETLWHKGESWRLWVTNRLAVAMTAARRNPALNCEPWEFALHRIRLDGVDPCTWSPGQVD